MLTVREIAKSFRKNERVFMEADDSHGEIRDDLQDALREVLPTGDGFWFWITDIWDDFLIYEQETPGNPAVLFKRDYSITDDVVTLGDAVEVEKKVEYVPVDGSASVVVESAGATIPLIESVTANAEHIPQIIDLVEASVRQDGTIPIKVIEPGWGSSAYYPAKVLERDGPKVFCDGTHMGWDHMTEAEFDEQPEGELNNFAAILQGDSWWDAHGPTGEGLYANAKVFEGYREKVDEMAPYIGTSISTEGVAEGVGGRTIEGEREGRKGPILQELLKNNFTSVDFVTKAGAGGAVLQLFESARPQRKQKEAPTMPETVELQEKLTAAETENAELKVKVEEGEADKTELTDLRETALITEASKAATGYLKDIDLKDVTKAKIIKEVAKNPPLKEGKLDTEALEAATTAVATEAAEYIESLTGAGTVTGMGESNAPDDAGREKLRESLKRSHPNWDEKMVESFVNG